MLSLSIYRCKLGRAKPDVVKRARQTGARDLYRESADAQKGIFLIG